MNIAVTVEEVIEHEIVIDPAEHQADMNAHGVDTADPDAVAAWVKDNRYLVEGDFLDVIGDHTVQSVNEREICHASPTTKPVTTNPSTATEVHFAVILTGEIKGGYAGTILGRTKAEVLAQLRENFDSEGDLASTPDDDLVETMEEHFSLRITLDTQTI